MHWACLKGHMSIVKYLIEDMLVDPNYCDPGQQSAVSQAAIGGHQDVLEYLIEKGASLILMDKTAEQSTPLHWLCENKHITLMQWCIREREKDINLISPKCRNKLLDLMQISLTDHLIFLTKKNSMEETILDIYTTLVLLDYRWNLNACPFIYPYLFDPLKENLRLEKIIYDKHLEEGLFVSLRYSDPSPDVFFALIRNLWAYPLEKRSHLLMRHIHVNETLIERLFKIAAQEGLPEDILKSLEDDGVSISAYLPDGHQLPSYTKKTYSTPRKKPQKRKHRGAHMPPSTSKEICIDSTLYREEKKLP